MTSANQVSEVHLNRMITSCWTLFNIFQILIKELIILWEGKTDVFPDAT